MNVYPFVEFCDFFGERHVKISEAFIFNSLAQSITEI